MSGLRVGGQCEGYGGIFQALQQHLDVEHAWYAETDEAACKVLAHHYPGVTNHGDITTFDWSTAEPVDVFTSGFPCQPFSAAGKRAGTADERHLWPTGVLPAIEALMPPLVVLENVRNLLTIEDGQVFAQVLADLDDLGYTTSWTTVGACKVGACHHRHRVFIAATLVETAAPLSDPVAHRTGAGWGPAQFVLFGDAGAVAWPASGFTSGGTAWELPVSTCGADEVPLNLLPTPLASLGRSAGFPSPRLATERMAAGKRCLDDAIALLPTPHTSDTNGVGLHGGGGLDLRTAVSMLPTPTARDSARGAGRTFVEGRPLSEVIALLPTPRASDGEKGGPNQRGSSGDVMLPAAVQPERFGKYAAAVHRHELAYGLTVPDPTEPGKAGRPRLAPGFPEWMQGLPPGWLTDVADRKNAIRLAGNGVNVRQGAYAIGLLLDRLGVNAATFAAVAA